MRHIPDEGGLHLLALLCFLVRYQDLLIGIFVVLDKEISFCLAGKDIEYGA